LRTDEKHIHAQSAILYKTPAFGLVFTVTVFFVRMRFSSVQKKRLARAARKSAGDKYSKRRIPGDM